MTHKIKANFSFIIFYVWPLTKCQNMQLVFLDDWMMLYFCILQTSHVNHISETSRLLPTSRHTDRPQPGKHKGVLLQAFLDSPSGRQWGQAAYQCGRRTRLPAQPWTCHSSSLQPADDKNSHSWMRTRKCPKHEQRRFRTWPVIAALLVQPFSENMGPERTPVYSPVMIQQNHRKTRGQRIFMLKAFLIHRLSPVPKTWAR